MTINRRSATAVLLAVWTVAAITSLKAQLAGGLQQNSPIPFHENVRKGKLANGMEYYLLKNAKPEKRVEIRLALKAGSVLEDEDQKGIAHFVEHMCFNGSKNFKKNELIDYLEKTGTKFGADLNAYTSFDETVYMLELRTDDQEIFNKGLLVFEDWAGGVSFDHQEIDKERGVVESEWRSRLSPDQRMQNRYFPVVYAGSQYGKRLPIGDMEIIRHAPYDNFKRFYRDWYRPELMALIMVGDIDLDAVEKQVKQRFSKLKNPANARPRVEFDVPKHKNTLVSVCSDKEATSTTVRLMYNHDYQKPVTIKDYRQELIYSLYNMMINARLAEVSQKADPPFNYAFSYYGADVGNSAKYNSFASVKDGAALTGLQAVLEENERAKRYGFTQSELDRMKKQTEKEYETAFKEQDKTLSRMLVSGIVGNFLDKTPFMSPGQEFELVKSLLLTISLDDVNACGRRFITDENRIVVITSPEKPDIRLPSEDEVLNMVNSAKDLRVEPYVDKVSTAPLMAKLPQKGSVVKEEKNAELGTTTWTLSNNAKVVLKPTTFKNDEILFYATSEGGTFLYPDADDVNASYASSVINTCGVGTFDNVQLDKYLTGKNLGVSSFIDNYREGMRGSTSVEDEETFFQLVNLYFTQPRKDPEAFNSFKTKRIAALKNFLSDPQRYFNVESNKIKTQNHPRTRFTTAEEIEKLDLDRMYDIYRERFANAADFTFFFTGSFTPESIKPFVEQYIASLPSAPQRERMKDLGIRFPEGVVEKSWSKGDAPKSNIDITFHTPFEYNDQNRYIFSSMVDILKIKLREELREDKGGVYGVSVYGNTKKFPVSESSITISFNCTPGNEKNLTDAAMDVIKKIKEIGASETDLLKVKETQRQERIKNLEQNNFWAGSLLFAHQNDVNPEQLLMKNYEKFINNLTAGDIKSAANQYLDEKSMIKIVADPQPEVKKP